MLKGVSFQMLLDFVDEVLKPGSLEVLLQSVSPEVRELYKAGITKSQWYPLRFFNDMEAAIINEFFDGDIIYARYIARYTMSRARSDIYRLAFLSFKKPLDAVHNINKIWTLYNKPGQAVPGFSDEKAKKATVKLVDVLHIPEMYKEHLAGWAETMLRTCGAEEAYVSWEDKGSEVIFTLEWE